MINIKDSAREQLSRHMAENKVESAIRVFVTQGCGGSSLGLALDEPNEGDFVQDTGGIKYVIDRCLLDDLGSVTLDYIESGQRSGFLVTSENPVAQEESSCGGCSCCG